MIMTLCWAITGMYLSILHGGNGGLKVPKAIKNILFAAGFGVASYFLAGPWLAAAAFATGLLIATGHGQWFSMGRWHKPLKAERLDILLVPFFGHDPRAVHDLDIEARVKDYGEVKLFWRCVAGMTLKHALLASGATVAAFMAGWVAGAIMLAAIVLSVSGYLIDTLPGEYVRGFVFYAGLALAVLA